MVWKKAENFKISTGPETDPDPCGSDDFFGFGYSLNPAKKHASEFRPSNPDHTTFLYQYHLNFTDNMNNQNFLSIDSKNLKI